MNVFNLVTSLEAAKLKNFLTLFAVGLLFWLSLTSLLATLPAYIQDIGGTPRQVGLVMGCFAIGLLLSRTLMGRIADGHSRKLVLLIGTAVAGLAPLGYVLAQTVPGLMALRAFHGISIASFTIGYSALVVDLSPVKQRGELIGYMNLAVPVGMAIGPAAGAFLADWANYKLLFLASASSGLLALILTTRVKEATNEPHFLKKKSNPDLPNRGFMELIGSQSLVIPSVVFLLIGLLFGTLITFLPLFVRELEIDLNVGLFYAAAAMASFCVRIFVGQVADRYGRGLFITLSLVCYLISMLLLASVDTPSTFLLSAIAEGIGAGILVPMMLALISDRCYENERGKVFSLCLGGFDVGIALGGPVLGSLTDTLGYRKMFLIAAGLAILALIVFITRSNKNFTQSFRFALGRGKDLYILN